jgi:nitrite reductase/ring-hydroxylating ferredoxin subunit
MASGGASAPPSAAAAPRTLSVPSTLPAVAAGASPPAPPGFLPVAPLAAVPLGLSSAPAFGGGPLVVARTPTALLALGLFCAHKGAELHLGEIEDAPRATCAGAAAPGVSIRCPRHRKKFPDGLLFDGATGAAWCAGAPQAGAWDAAWGKPGDVPAYATRVEADWLFVSAAPIAGAPSRAPESE